MDLGAFREMLGRHRRLVVVGLAATFLLAFFSYVQPSASAPGLSYREKEVWSNESTLLLTQPGFPEGRSVIPVKKGSTTTVATPDRFTSLVDLYAALVGSDEVIKRLSKRGLIDAKDLKEGKLPIAASAVPSVSGSATPLLRIVAEGDSDKEATALTMATTKEFVSFIGRQQAKARIPTAQRITVRVVQRAGEPQLVEPRSKSIPIVVLLAGLTATFALVSIADRLARRAASAAEEREQPDSIRAVPDEHEGEERAAPSVRRDRRAARRASRR